MGLSADLLDGAMEWHAGHFLLLMMVFAIQMGITGTFHQHQVMAINRPHICGRTLWLELRQAGSAGEVMVRMEPGFWKR